MVAPALTALLPIPHMQEGGDMSPALDTMELNELSEVLVLILMPRTPTFRQILLSHCSRVKMGRWARPALPTYDLFVCLFVPASRVRRA